MKGAIQVSIMLLLVAVSDCAVITGVSVGPGAAVRGCMGMAL